MQYTVQKTGESYWSVLAPDSEEVGRVVEVKGRFHARHSFRHEGGYLGSLDLAVKSIVAADLLIEAEFFGRVEIEVAA